MNLINLISFSVIRQSIVDLHYEFISQIQLKRYTK